jgi:hypothetical protein
VVSGELEQSLRAEIDRHVHSRLRELQEEVARLQGQVNEAFARLLESTAPGTDDNAEFASTIAEHIRAAHEHGLEDAAAEAAKHKDSSDIAVLKSAIENLDDQRTQADILNALVNRAASFAPRVAFFVIRNDQAIGWRARGLEGSVGDDSVREINLPLSADTLLGEAARRRATWSGAPGQSADEYQLLNRFGAEPPQHMVAVPLVVRDRGVALLYADSAGLGPDSIKLEALETLVRVAGMAVELLAVTRGAPSAQRSRADAAAPARAEEQPAAESAPQAASEYEPQPAAEEVVSQPAAEEFGQVETAPQAFEPAEEVTATPPTEGTSWQEVAHEPAPQSEPTDETYEAAPVEAAPPAQSFEPPAAAQAGPYSAPRGAAPRYGSADSELPVDVSEEERRLHNDARRFARLLVSEIKLYNEQKVREGRTQGDIYGRLREDIDRSREMYNKRVAPPVAARYDYFHHELVNTLAEGDPSKLGADYPGASASA